MEEALQAAEAAADIGAARRAPPPAPLLRVDRPRGAPVLLDEWQAKQLLAGFGLAHPGGATVASAEAAVALAERLGYPVVAKAVGRAVAHKTEQGAVALDLRGAAEVEVAARRLAGLGEAVLVEPMVTDGVAELIVGIGRDPLVGLHLVVGAGGILVELIEDSTVLLLPTTAEAVGIALARLRVWPLLQGFRGRPRGDVAAAVAAVLAVARFALAHADRLVELDVNPLIVRPEGLGAVAVDALVRLAAAPED
jgi:succinyl-CoA synthetase beta subunit